jgi:hypothetical protein
VRVTGGLYDSRSEGISNLSSYFAVGRELSSWLDAELFLLQSRPSGRPSTTTPIVNLRWRLSPRVRLMQQLSVHDRRPTILFGANLITALGEFGADYQIVHQPFQPFKPFRSTLNLTARLQLGRYSTNLGTYVRPDGSVDYSASGSTFLYMGAFGGVQPQQLGQSLGRYIVRGVVRDETGAPVEGAAVDLSGQMAFTNSRGEFFVRIRRPQRYALTIPLDEFLLPGHWTVVTAPTDVIAERENQARAVEVILRRASQVPPAPATPTAPSMTGDSAVWQSADTLYRVRVTAMPGDLPGSRVRFQGTGAVPDETSPARWLSSASASPRARTPAASLGWTPGPRSGRCRPLAGSGVFKTPALNGLGRPAAGERCFAPGDLGIGRAY